MQKILLQFGVLPALFSLNSCQNHQTLSNDCFEEGVIEINSKIFRFGAKEFFYFGDKNCSTTVILDEADYVKIDEWRFGDSNKSFPVPYDVNGVGVVSRYSVGGNVSYDIKMDEGVDISLIDDKARAIEAIEESFGPSSVRLHKSEIDDFFGEKND